jgi:hypothetical protein
MTSNKFLLLGELGLNRSLTLHGHPCFGKQVIWAAGRRLRMFDRILQMIGCLPELWVRTRGVHVGTAGVLACPVQSTSGSFASKVELQ